MPGIKNHLTLPLPLDSADTVSDTGLCVKGARSKEKTRVGWQLGIQVEVGEVLAEGNRGTS